MTDKTYWIADRLGNKALVTGADQRDRWLPHGWTDSDEPTGDELLWARYEDVADPAQFPHAIFREVWEPKGWTSSAPPEPIDPLTGVRPPAPVTPPAAVPAEKTTTKAAAGGDKESPRG